MTDLGQASELRQYAEQMIHAYFTTQQIPLTKHHIDSYDQFLERDLINIIKSKNPLINLKNKIENSDEYMYRVEVYVGGETGSDIFLGSPAINLEQGKEVRVLYPNEARLRNLTYSLQVEADIFVRVTIRTSLREEPLVKELKFERFSLFQLPLMLHSRYCILNGKSPEFLTEAGECPQDSGGYFVVDGSEKVLITRQEAAFNTLYVSEQPRDPKISHYATITSLNSKTRVTKRVAFYWTRERNMIGTFGRPPKYLPSILEVSIPYSQTHQYLYSISRSWTSIR
jgi:DNA-directed RNA polymerase beta subunit